MAVAVHGNGHEPSLGQLQGDEILALAPVVASVQGNDAGSRILRRGCLWLVNGEADIMPQAVYNLDVLGDHAAKIRIDQGRSKNGNQADNDRDQEKFCIKLPIQFHLKYLPFLSVKYVTVRDGGEIGAGSSVKLACKLLFVPISASDGHPMLLGRLFRSRR